MTRSSLLGVLGAVAGALATLGMATVTAPASGPAQSGPAPTEHAGHVSGDPAAQATMPPQPSARRDRSPGALLRRATLRHAGRWENVDDARAAGYRSIGDAVTGYEHYVHPDRLSDEIILEPRRPESLVYEVDGSERTLVSLMYILPPGSTIADAPDLEEPGASWHRHKDLCWDDDGRIAGLFRDGRCIPGGERVVTPPMLHVWVVDHPCGPFAGLEGHGDSCPAH